MGLLPRGPRESPAPRPSGAAPQPRRAGPVSRRSARALRGPDPPPLPRGTCRVSARWRGRSGRWRCSAGDSASERKALGEVHSDAPFPQPSPTRPSHARTAPRADAVSVATKWRVWLVFLRTGAGLCWEPPGEQTGLAAKGTAGREDSTCPDESSPVTPNPAPRPSNSHIPEASRKHRN